MKFKKILSTALTVIMIFTALVSVMPMTAEAAYSSNIAESEQELTAAEVKAIVQNAVNYNKSSAYELLREELDAGYLYSINTSDGEYSLYVNRYTGYLYYVNNVTGQILTSNPYNPGYGNVTTELRQSLMSQITVSIVESANTTKSYEFNSIRDAALRNQISVSRISGGFRVNYTLGNTTTRFLLPNIITSERFEEFILIPMIQKFEELMAEHCEDGKTNVTFFENEKYTPYEYNCISTSQLTKYLTAMNTFYIQKLSSTSEAYKDLENVRIAIRKITATYSCHNPARYADIPSMIETMNKNYPITIDGTAVYVLTSDLVTADKTTLSSYISKFCPDYNFTMMAEDEKECGYVAVAEQNPVVKCALEYTFNADNTLSVRLPANSIVFDETVYTLKSVTPFEYFGCGDMTRDGYIFYPDGSGTIVDFYEFYNASKITTLKFTNQVYGTDYCYSSITQKHREQVTMPVYGLVNEVTANETTANMYGVENVNNGFFALLEEGASLATLTYESGGSTHKYANVYASYTPRPSDTYDLSDTITVGGLGEYIIVSDSRYTGSYITRYVMLTDSKVGDAAYGAGKYYASSYSGMAAYYRNHLKSTGVLEALEFASEDLPLYIEVFGSMEIITRVLTFPVTKKIPLTTFDNVSEMFNQLSNSIEYIKQKADEARANAAVEIDEGLKDNYLEDAARLDELATKVQNITNINFRLTGFSNGGMYYTYPTKVRWEKVCGGKGGFVDLVNTAKDKSTAEGVNFGVYPEFDFMYINFTDLFDGISVKGNVSRMVDNRYASKQAYNMVLDEYISDFTLVITPDALGRLYSKFYREFSGYELKTISVSTLGSDLNSNFDDENAINRDESSVYVAELLEKVTAEDGFELMMDKGNAYALKYATHILNAATDSSHSVYASYTVPFTGMVLHSYVNYASTPFNYSGSPSYDLLRAIENGASLYYILCYQNTAYMKDDYYLNEYYGVDYKNWYDSIVEVYTELNAVIGDLQGYEIIDHSIIIAERVIDESETAANFNLLKEELLEMIEAQLIEKIDAAYAELRQDPANVGCGIKLDLDVDELINNQILDILNTDRATLEADGFVDAVNAIAAKYEAAYASDNANAYNLVFNSIEYNSKYTYLTDSLATDEDYVYTDYTVDNGKVAIVTYSNGTDIVRIVLNYNIYAVSVKLADGESYELGKHGYIRLD
ncbi:MAG: hypothetical protein IJY65_03870 [Clostridia bacterium]|nr:hypothetical protein [Clostridia bacterium]